MNWTGLDIGGANLKAAWPTKPACPAIEIPFPMWTDHQKLDEALAQLMKHAGTDDAVAVTMTGELADGFESREHGVFAIAKAVEEVCDGRIIRYYCNDGSWLEHSEVTARWDNVAAANWHAAARWGARFLPDQTGLVIDVGSTTTDVSPVVAGMVTTAGSDDWMRLSHNELVYVGAGRTPVCGLLNEVQHAGRHIPLANELFATTSDVLIWLKLTTEDQDDINTADGRPKTRGAAGQRLARMVCRDLRDVEESVIDAIAQQAYVRLQETIGKAIAETIRKIDGGAAAVLLVGEGSFIAEGVLEKMFPTIERILMSDRINFPASACGPAYAVAALAAEELFQAGPDQDKEVLT